MKISQVFAFAIALAIVYLSHGYWTNYRAEKFASQFVVASAVVGNGTEVVYSREIGRDARGNWYVQVFKIEDDDTLLVCSGGGEATYSVEAKGVIRRTMEWYIGNECMLEPGQYFMKTFYKLEDIATGTPFDKEMTSPVFTVRKPQQLEVK